MHDILNRKELDMDVFDKHFMYNIRWVLKTYQPVCQHFVWLGNTANGNEGIDPPYPQTVANMEECDTDVKKAIGSDPELQSIVSFIDVQCFYVPSSCRFCSYGRRLVHGFGQLANSVHVKEGREYVHDQWCS